MREPWSFLAKEESASGRGSGSEGESEGRGVRPRGVRGRHVRQDLHLAIAVDSNARVRGAPGERAKREARVRESEGGAHVGRDQCVQIDTDHCGRTRRASERMGANERANERTSKRANEQTSKRASESQQWAEGECTSLEHVPGPETSSAESAFGTKNRASATVEVEVEVGNVM